MSLMVKITAWVNFLSVKVAGAELDETEAANELARIEAIASMSTDGKQYDKKAAKDSDPGVIEARKILQEARAKRKALTLFVDARERYGALLSRELTRRTGGKPYQQRSDRMNP